MNRIIINEQDLTTGGTTAFLREVVYVPGFSKLTIGQNEAAGVHEPKLCTSVGQFETYFGNIVPTFGADQLYSSLPDAFDNIAIPGTPATAVMFNGGSPDLGYVFAKELLLAGIPVVYERVNNETTTDTTGVSTTDISIKAMYTYLAGDCYSTTGNLSDKALEIKYLTSGGYPTFEYNSNAIVNLMTTLANNRGDCVAYIDHTNNSQRELTGSNSVFAILNSSTSGITNAQYGAMFTPWASYGVSTGLLGTVLMPASFGYFLALAKSIKINSNFLSIAGVIRGQVPSIGQLNTTAKLTNAIADAYQKSMEGEEFGVSLNAITYVNNYGYCIWGNRTLLKSSANMVGFASNYLNLRNMVSDVKKQVYTSAQSLLFEQNTEILWINFKAKVTPLLDQLVSGGGLTTYKIIKNASSIKSKVTATIKLYPIYPIDSFEIGIVLSDDEVSTTE